MILWAEFMRPPPSPRIGLGHPQWVQQQALEQSRQTEEADDGLEQDEGASRAKG